MKKFKSKKEAIDYCMDMIKPTNLESIDEYNSLRLIRGRYQKDPESVKENAIQRLFETFDVKTKCTFYIEGPAVKQEKPLTKSQRIKMREDLDNGSLLRDDLSKDQLLQLAKYHKRDEN